MARPHNRSLPLNIKGNRDHLFVRVLTEARSQAIKNAREWPIAVPNGGGYLANIKLRAVFRYIGVVTLAKLDSSFLDKVFSGTAMARWPVRSVLRVISPLRRRVI